MVTRDKGRPGSGFTSTSDDLSAVAMRVDLFLSGTKAQTVHTPNFLPGARAHRPVPLQAQAQNPQILGRIGAVKSVKVNQLKEAIKHGRQQQQQKQQKQHQNRDFLQQLHLTSNRAPPSENNPAEAGSSSECAQWFQQRQKEGAAAGSALIWRDGVKIPVKPAGRVLGGLGTFRRVQRQQRTPAVPQHQPPPGSCEAQRSTGENVADVGAAQDTLASRALLLRAQQPRAFQAPVTEAPKHRPPRSARAPGRVADESSWGPWGIVDSAESGSSPAHRAASDRVHSGAEVPESLGVGGEATAAPSLSGTDHGHAPLAPIIVAVAPREACGDESARHARLGRSARGPAVGDEGSGDGAGGAGEDETGGDDARPRRSYNPDEERLRAARRLFARKEKEAARLAEELDAQQRKRVAKFEAKQEETAAAALARARVYALNWLLSQQEWGAEAAVMSGALSARGEHDDDEDEGALSTGSVGAVGGG